MLETRKFTQIISQVSRSALTPTAIKSAEQVGYPCKCRGSGKNNRPWVKCEVWKWSCATKKVNTKLKSHRQSKSEFAFEFRDEHKKKGVVVNELMNNNKNWWLRRRQKWDGKKISKKKARDLAHLSKWERIRRLIVWQWAILCKSIGPQLILMLILARLHVKPPTNQPVDRSIKSPSIWTQFSLSLCKVKDIFVDCRLELLFVFVARSHLVLLPLINSIKLEQHFIFFKYLAANNLC